MWEEEELGGIVENNVLPYTQKWSLKFNFFHESPVSLFKKQVPTTLRVQPLP